MRLPALLSVLLLSLLASCSGIQVDTDYDPGYDFSGLRTWSFLEHPDGPGLSPLALTRVEAAVRKTLAAKGLSEQTDQPEKAQVRVVIQGTTTRRVAAHSWGLGYGYRYGRRGFGAWPYGSIDVYEYDEGALILDVLSGAEKRLVWRGIGSKARSRGMDPAAREAETRALVEATLKDFPPKQGASDGPAKSMR